MSMTVLPCLMVNDCENHALEIMAGYKTIETRNHKRLDKYIGKTLGIIRTGKGNPLLLGTIRIGSRKEYKSVAAFAEDYERHLVSPNSKFYMREGEKKYGYEVTFEKVLLRELEPQKGGNRLIRLVEIDPEPHSSEWWNAEIEDGCYGACI